MVLVGPLVPHFLHWSPFFPGISEWSLLLCFTSLRRMEIDFSGSPRGREGSRQRHCTRTQNIADDWKWNRVLKCHPKRRNQHHGRLMTTGGIIKLMSYVDIHTHIYILTQIHLRFDKTCWTNACGYVQQVQLILLLFMLLSMMTVSIVITMCNPFNKYPVPELG